jgi:multidrug efflux pump subunit AcrA (membrane-fusion protein)
MGIRLRKSWLIGAAAAVVLALGSTGAYLLTGGDEAGAGKQATTTVKRGTVAAAVAASGTLQPAQTRGLAFSMEGTVTEVRVRAGDQVTAGQVLARIDDTDAKEKVSSAQDALDAAEESLDAAEEAESASTSSSAAGCVAAAAYASPSPSSSASPSPSASASRTSPPTAPAAPTTGSTGRTNGPTGGPITGGNCANSGGTNGGGANAGGGTDRVLGAQQQVNNAKLQLENAEQDLAGTTIKAPIAGKVLSVAGAVGSRATANGSGFIVLGDVADMQVKASFPEADASGLKVGQKATVTLADRPDETLAAKVTQVDPIGTVDGQMVRFGALLAFDKVPGDVLSGQSANVRVEIDSVTDVLYVPTGAVHGSTVKVVRGAATEERQVEVGLRGDQYAEIRSGLAEGEEVATSW